MSKKMVIIVSLALVMGIMSPVNVYAADGTDNDFTVPFHLEDIYGEYKDSVEFQGMLGEYGTAYAQQFLQDVLDTRREEMLRGGGGNVCYQYVKNIQQTSDHNCGSATVLQTLYGLGQEKNVLGDTDEEKMAQLDKEYKVDETGSMMVYRAVNALNKYSDRTYIYEEMSKESQDSFEDKIAASLTNCRPVILHAKTKHISYYRGHQSGHYISLDYVNRQTDMVRLVDCNWNDAYYGVHSVGLGEAYKSVHEESGRYLIR